MLIVSEEHRWVFPKLPLVSFKRCKNLRDILVRAKLHSGGGGRAIVIQWDVLRVISLDIRFVLFDGM